MPRQLVVVLWATKPDPVAKVEGSLWAWQTDCVRDIVVVHGQSAAITDDYPHGVRLTVVDNIRGNLDTLCTGAEVIHKVQSAVHDFTTDEGTGSTSNKNQALWLESPEAEGELAAIPHVNVAFGVDVVIEAEDGQSPEEGDFNGSRDRGSGRLWGPGPEFVRFVDDDPTMSWRMRLNVGQKANDRNMVVPGIFSVYDLHAKKHVWMLNTVPIFDDILYTNKRYKYYEKYCLYLIKVFQCCYPVPSPQQIILTTNIFCVGRKYFVYFLH